MHPMTGMKIEIGPTGHTVAANVQRRREELRLTYAQLSRRLVGHGRLIPTLGLRRIEAGERRVDVDELLAIALALDVTPITLLMPHPPNGGKEVAVTATGVNANVRAFDLWNWLTAAYPIVGPVLAFYSAALPPWERSSIEDTIGVKR